MPCGGPQEPASGRFRLRCVLRGAGCRCLFEHWQATETHPSKLIEKDSKIEPMPLVRRKLNDNVMSEFLIGNTFARTLLTKEEANLVDEHSILKLLWVGCGDIRNPLTTLKMLKKNQKVHLFFNDISIVTLARDILLLTLLTFNYDDHHGEMTR